MDLLLGGSLIAAGLLLLRRAKRASGGPTIHASRPGTAPSAPQSVAPAASASTPAVEELSTHPEAPSGNTMPPGEYEQFINKNGLQTFVLRVNMETDPDRKEDMKLALVDYYRDKVNPNDQTSSDTQILTMLGVKLPQRSDAAPEGAVSAFQSSDYVYDPTKTKLENEYLNLESSIKSQEFSLGEKRRALSDIEAKANAKKSDGTYDTDKAKVLQDIKDITDEIERLKKKKTEIEPAYNEEKERLNREAEMEKRRQEEKAKKRREDRIREEEKRRRMETSSPGESAPKGPRQPGHFSEMFGIEGIG